MNYAKALLLKLSEFDLEAIFTGLKDTVILVACQASTATLRAKSLKIVSQIIKVNPSYVLDEKIKNMLHLRAADTSVVARESALDLLFQYLR